MKYLNYDALNKNILFFRKRIKQAKLCAVVKNDAYGHGLVHIAYKIAPLVDCFAVGGLCEAESIAFLNKDILILLPQNEQETERAIKNNCILTLDSFSTLDRIAAAAEKLKMRARVHIKVDSGMSRLGFVLDDLNELTVRLDFRRINVEGVFSHFFGDSLDTCNKQLKYFEKCVDYLKKFYPFAICHIANTSAALLSPKFHLDMVRIGLGLYGYGDEQLVPVKTVRATVIAVKKVQANSTVGYGAIYRPKQSTRIAVIDTGYAKGFSRMLVGARILIKGHYCTVAAVCMAMTLVDVEDFDIYTGDSAIILGENINISNENISVYELLCNLR